jgi:DNA-directed RNA polymerase beta' subunit
MNIFQFICRHTSDLVMASALCLLSDEHVVALAAFDVTESLDLHDARFGNAGSTEVVCPTCGMRGEVCTGHHASLSLGISMFHPLLYKESQKILNSVCFECGRSLVRVAKSKARKCADCGVVNHGDYVVYANDMSAAVRSRGGSADYRLAESFVSVLPEGHVISRVLVPPIHLRTPEDMEWSTDIQKLYEQLVLAVRRRGDVCAAYSKITGAHRNEGVTGIMSGKGGVFRKLMMGKRVELSARAVVVGDPDVELDQVAVPRSTSVRVKTSCCGYNADALKSMADAGCLWWEGTDDAVLRHHILPGMTFERDLTDGDVVMLNRQPSLSKQSLACFRALIRKDGRDVFGINPQSTPPFNADFDGDEMNTFFMSQSGPVPRAEMSVLCRPETHGSVPVQDVVTGCHIMSRDDSPVSAEVAGDCAVITGKIPKKQTTHGLIATCIPGYRGEVLYKKNIIRSDVDLQKMQLVVERWLVVKGLTVSMVPSIRLDRRPGERPDAYRERCLCEVSSRLQGTGLMDMIDAGAKGSLTHAAHMAVALGQQYVGGREGTFCTRSYRDGLTPGEFFGHQMAAREGVVSTGVITANTGYLNRRACKVMADLKLQYNGTVADDVMISSFSAVQPDAKMK